MLISGKTKKHWPPAPGLHPWQGAFLIPLAGTRQREGSFDCRLFAVLKLIFRFYQERLPLTVNKHLPHGRGPAPLTKKAAIYPRAT